MANPVHGESDIPGIAGVSGFSAIRPDTRRPHNILVAGSELVLGSWGNRGSELRHNRFFSAGRGCPEFSDRGDTRSGVCACGRRRRLGFPADTP